MGMKKGQVTIFIILAIVFVTIIGLILFINSGAEKEGRGRDYFEQQGIRPSLANIQDFIVECHEEISRTGLDYIGLRGGYYEVPDYYFDMGWVFIPYYYYEGLILMPEIKEIESEISNYVDDNINNCFEKINFKNFDLEYGDSETRTRIDKKKVVINTKLSVKVEHEGEITDFRLSEYELSIESYLNEIYEVADFITESHKKNPELMCINCIIELAKERDIYVDFISISDDSTLVMLLENKTTEKPYIFQFINKYNIKMDVIEEI